MTENKYTPHVHAEVIKAWADGATIEYKNGEGNWVTAVTPTFLPEYEYRVKPERVVAYTVVNTHGQSGTIFISSISGLDDVYNVPGWDLSQRQGYLKRTMLDGKVVSFEFIPK